MANMSMEPTHAHTQLFDAPPRVREAVLQQAHLGETLVGNEKLEETARTSDWMAKKPVISGRLVQVLMTPNTEFRAKRASSPHICVPLP